MADTPLPIKIPEDIEIRVIGNAICLLIACGGLLAGAMVGQRSIEYWQEDLVLLLIVFFCALSLLRNLMATLTLAMAGGSAVVHAKPRGKGAERVQQEAAAVGQLPSSRSSRGGPMTEEKVVEAVLKRIESQKAQANKSPGSK